MTVDTMYVVRTSYTTRITLLISPNLFTLRFDRLTVNYEYLMEMMSAKNDSNYTHRTTLWSIDCIAKCVFGMWAKTTWRNKKRHSFAVHRICQLRDDMSQQDWLSMKWFKNNKEEKFGRKWFLCIPHAIAVDGKCHSKWVFDGQASIGLQSVNAMQIYSDDDDIMFASTANGISCFTSWTRDHIQHSKGRGSFVAVSGRFVYSRISLSLSLSRNQICFSFLRRNSKWVRPEAHGHTEKETAKNIIGFRLQIECFSCA